MKLLCRKTSKRIHGTLNANEPSVLFEADFSAGVSADFDNTFLTPALGTLTLSRMRHQLFEVGQEYWLDLSETKSKFPLAVVDKLAVR